MSIYTYTYPFTSFPHGIIAKDTLYSEVQNSSITAALQSIDNDLINVYFNFKASLSAGEITTLNTIVANHQGVPLTETVTVIQGSSGSVPWNVSIPTSSITYVSQQTGSYLSVSGTVHIDNPVNSISVLNFPITQSVKIDQTITLPVSVSNLIGITGSVGITGVPSVFITNPVTTSSISNFPTTQSVIVNNSLLPVSVSNLVSVTGSVAAAVSFPIIQNVSLVSSSVTQSIIGSIGIVGIPNVTITNSVTTASISNFPVTQSVKIDQSIVLPVSVSNNPTITIGNFPLTQSVFVGNSVMPVSTSNTVTITGSVYQINQPLTQSVKIDQTIQLPVSVSNFPTIQNVTGTMAIQNASFVSGALIVYLSGESAITQSITGSITVSNFPVTQSVFVGNSILPVSISNFPTVQNITGAVGISGVASVSVINPATTASISNFPITQSIKIDQTIQLPVSLSNNPTITIGNFPTTQSIFVSNPVTTASISNFPITQSVFVGNSILTVSMSNNPTIAIGNFPTTQSVYVGGYTSIPQPTTIVSSSVTQSVLVINASLPVSISNSPIITIGNFPTTQSVFIGNSVTLPVSVSNLVTVTGSVGTSITFPVLQNVSIISSSVTQSITGTVGITNPVTTMSIGNFPITQSVFVGNFPTTQSIFVGGYTGSPQPTTIISSSITQSITGSVAILNFPITQSIFVGSSVVLPMSLSNNPTITIGNFPTTQSIFVAGYTNSPQPTAIISSSITQSITGSVAVLNFPVTQSVFIGGYTNAIQPVSISNQPTVIVNQGISSSVAWRVKDDKESTFSLLVTGSAIGNAKSMVSVQNASSAGNIVKIRSVKIINIQTVAVTGIAAEFRFLKATSHSAGTLLTPVTFDSIDSADANITWRTGATIAGSTAIPLLRYFWSSDEWVIGTLDQEAHDKGLQNLIAAYKAGPEQKPITIRPSEAFTITQITNSTVGTFDIEIIYTQEPE